MSSATCYIEIIPKPRRLKLYIRNTLIRPEKLCLHVNCSSVNASCPFDYIKAHYNGCYMQSFRARGHMTSLKVCKLDRNRPVVLGNSY